MKDRDEYFKEMAEIFTEMDKVFKQVDTIVSQAQTRFVPRKTETGPWQSWFAWRPVTVKGQRVWFKTVYRRCINTYVDFDNWKRYEYGDIFDLIKDPT